MYDIRTVLNEEQLKLLEKEKIEIKNSYSKMSEIREFINSMIGKLYYDDIESISDIVLDNIPNEFEKD